VENFITDIFNTVRSCRFDVLLPMDDITTEILSHHKDELSQNTILPISDHQDIELAMDKSRLLKLAQEEGVPIPKTIFPRDLEEIKEIAEKLKYQVIIKHRKSRYYLNGKYISGGVNYAFSKEELVKKYEEMHLQIPFPLVQERIEGVGIGIFVLMNRSQLRAIFSHRRIREKPPSGGVSVLCESIVVDERMKEYALKILKRLNWHGVAMIEFKVDSSDNTPKLMEVNGRFWGSLQLAISSGVDFPYLLYQMAVNEDVDPVFSYEVGIKNRWFWGDFDHLIALLTKSNRVLKLPSKNLNRLVALRNFLKFRDKNLNYEVFSRFDLKPILFESWQYILNLAKGLTSSKVNT